MQQRRLEGKRVLVTSCGQYMGPAIVDLFRAEGANVVADARELIPSQAAAAAVTEGGSIDVLVANLALAPRRARADQITDEDWHALFDALVHPLMRLVRAVLPQMIERRSGKIVAVTSAAPLRGIPSASAYCAARGAQNAFVRAVGLEVARHNVQVNAVAQNYVENNVYYPPELALYLASDRSDFMVGQVIPFAGGWA
jgi:2-keto-3-deoxy-L-fuconate dehydrogenase